MTLSLLAKCLVFPGALILTGAMLRVLNLISLLPAGPVRCRWCALMGLIGFFVIGYISYGIIFWNQHKVLIDLLVPVIFFFGSWFVWLTVTLSHQTVADARRVVVLERESITDPLLGIYNRRYLDSHVHEEFARAHRHALPLSLMLIDIDYFKGVNDAYGHQVGDLVLKYSTKLLLETLRSSDIAVRYGGEEVLILAPNLKISEAGTMAERLRRHMEMHGFKLTNGTDESYEIRITISVGVASLSPEAPDYKSVISNADAALYRAKQKGRNCVVIHGAKVQETRPETCQQY